ncbi:hypothetical protein L484_006803 [Morus notabilis]|uniref:Uncharacterized protein n=1 Tax=Morus notabilis TaxID=981085 RepID=W9S567_9ROSA|nr:hypothetical protein L484_006803 [Morus notabilis]
MKSQLGISYGQYNYTISVVMIFLLMVSFGMQVKASRPLIIHHHVKLSKTSSSHRLKIAKAYSGPSNKGIGHAIMHDNVLPINYASKRLKITQAYSGPSRRGVGHGLSHLLRNRSSTP